MIEHIVARTRRKEVFGSIRPNEVQKLKRGQLSAFHKNESLTFIDAKTGRILNIVSQSKSELVSKSYFIDDDILNRISRRDRMIIEDHVRNSWRDFKTKNAECVDLWVLFNFMLKEGSEQQKEQISMFLLPQDNDVLVIHKFEYAVPKGAFSYAKAQWLNPSTGISGSDSTKLLSLTAAELEVLISLVSGRTAEQISEQRKRQVSTVRTQLQKIKKKMGAASFAQLGYFAFLEFSKLESY